MAFNKGSYEDKQDNIRELELPKIEVFDNIYDDKDFSIKFEIPEFTAICPKTGLPDFGTIFIEYSPNKVCLELKSLKEYITAFRNIGIFHENVVNRICDDLIQAADMKRLNLEAVYSVRGGITTSVSRSYSK